MKVEKYDIEKHCLILKDWLTARKLTLPHEDLFSDIGFVVNNIAIGFLFLTNSKQAYIDHLATDPKSDKEERRVALDKLFETLEKTATDKGCLMITGLASMPAVRTRLDRGGYAHYGEFGLYYKVLGR